MRWNFCQSYDIQPRSFIIRLSQARRRATVDDITNKSSIGPSVTISSEASQDGKRGFQSGIVFRSIGSNLKNYTCLFQFYFGITADPVEIGVVRSPSLWVTQVWRRVFIWDFIDWFDSMKYLFYACRKHLRSWIFKFTWPQRVFIVFSIPFVGQVNGPQEPN